MASATVLECIQRAAERRKEHTALLWLGEEEERWSYQEAWGAETDPNRPKIYRSDH